MFKLNHDGKIHNYILIYFTQVEKSNHFRRQGADVHSDAPISIAQAVLGGTVRIPGLFEEINLNVSCQCYNTHN